jgi:hypothetical protein
MEASIYDYELIEETGVRMNPGAPAQAKSWTREMHTCIIVAPYKDRTLLSGYRVITTTSTPTKTFWLGELVKLGSEKRGSLGTWRVIGVVNIFTMNTLGRTPDRKIPHWILK